MISTGLIKLKLCEIWDYQYQQYNKGLKRCH